MKEANKIFYNSLKHLINKNGVRNKKDGVLKEELVQML